MNRLYFQWHITDACNFRCRHCYQDNFDCSSEFGQAGLIAVADNIIKEAARQNTQAVINITGGEPFLKKELFGLLAYLDKHKEIEELLLISNGSLINPDIIKKMKEVSKLKQVKVSLDGANSQSNDTIRGSGAFAKAMEGIRLLKNSGFSVTVMFTVTASNLKGLPGMYALCKENSIDGLIVERFFPLGTGKQIESQLLERDDWLRLVKELHQAAGQEYEDCEMASERAFWVKFSDDGDEVWGANCNVGRDSFCIMPNADVYPCRRFIFKLGNLLKTPLRDIINSAKLSDIIKGSRKGRCFECDILDCQGCPALAYLLTGDYHAADAQCWYLKGVKPQP